MCTFSENQPSDAQESKPIFHYFEIHFTTRTYDKNQILHRIIMISNKFKEFLYEITHFTTVLLIYIITDLKFMQYSINARAKLVIKVRLHIVIP